MSDIAELRKHLFETLEGLKNKSIAVETAQAINATAQTIVNTAKVEVDFMKVSGRIVNSEFIALPEKTTNGPQTPPTAHGTKTVTPLAAGATKTVHQMR